MRSAPQHWQILQLAPTSTPGLFKVLLRRNVPRHINQKRCVQCEILFLSVLQPPGVGTCVNVSCAVHRCRCDDELLSCFRCSQWQAWVLLGAALYAVPLKAERVLYIDATVPQAEAAEALGLGARVTLVKRHTPTSEKPVAMYQVRYWATLCCTCAAA